MKTINVTFEDKEIAQIEKKKGELSWHDYILQIKKEGGLNGNEGQIR